MDSIVNVTTSTAPAVQIMKFVVEILKGDANVAYAFVFVTQTVSYGFIVQPVSVIVHLIKNLVEQRTGRFVLEMVTVYVGDARAHLNFPRPQIVYLVMIQ